MSILVVGSVGLDSVETPFGSRTNAIGGAATYFSVAASYFSAVHMVATIGNDFPQESLDTLRRRGIDLDGLTIREGKTFRWSGRYGFDLNDAETLDTQLNVFADFNPILTSTYRQVPYVFLANIDPELQLQVLDQMEAPKFVGCDTMNYWIDGKPDALRATLSKVDLLTINEPEARLLSGEPNIRKAAQIIRDMGPKYLVVKRGEYGALLFAPEEIFFSPAFPLESVNDPTGAGDSFAGGFMGLLANQGEITIKSLKQATIMGCVMAGFNVESFSYDGLLRLSDALIAERFQEFRELVGAFDSLPLDLKPRSTF